MKITFEPTVDAPYPGLRPFLRDESMVFFGRDGQIDDVLSRLKKRQFLAIVGSSGCGKSSLVRAGVLPALESGLMGELGSKWYVADMKPGDAPVTNLADALAKCGVFGSHWSDSPEAAALLPAVLRQSDKSLVNLVRQAQLPPHTNLLILADQFEEIFRFQQKDPNEALAFVNLLLTSGHDKSLPIYIVLTMRTDFLGECTNFPGLPEILNDSQYLCPRLTRDQLAEAIQSPAEVFNSRVEPALVTRLINDAEGNSDQLPLVQHVLSRIWNQLNGGSMAIGTRSASLVLRLEDYVQTGGLVRRSQNHGSTIGKGSTGDRSNAAGNSLYESQTNALSQHLDEAYFSLADDSPASADHGPGHKPSRKQLIAQMLFRSLAARGASGSYVRRPTKVKDVAEISGCSVADVISVVDVFRRDDRCFLTPGKPDSNSLPAGTSDLKPDTLLDISHEALIRQWQRLGAHGGESGDTQATPSWLEIEENSRRRYRRLAEATENEKTAGLMRNPELEFFNQWWTEFRPSPAWANACVDGSFDHSEQFLKKSLAQAAEEAQEKQREQQSKIAAAEDFAAKMRYRAKAVAGVAALAFIGFLFAGLQSINASRQGANAKKQAAVAQQAAKDAISEKENAENAKKDADQAKIKADDALQEAVASQVREQKILDRAERLVYASTIESAQLAWGEGYADFARRSLDVAAWRLRGWEHDFLWTVFNENQKTLRGHTNYVNCVAISPDGKQVASGSRDKTVKVWDAVSFEEVMTLRGHAQSVSSVAFSADGKRIVSGSEDNTIKIWDASNGNEVRTIEGHEGKIYSVVFSPDGKRIVSGNEDGTAKVWYVRNGKESLNLKGHSAAVKSVAFSADGKFIATGSDDKTVKIWDASNGKELHTMSDPEDRVLSVAFNKEGTQIVCGCYGGDIFVWDAASGDKLHDWDGHSFEVSSVAFSPDGKRIVSGDSANMVREWDASNGKLLEKWTGHRSFVVSVAYSADGNKIVSSGWDYLVKIWDISSDRPKVEHEIPSGDIPFSGGVALDHAAKKMAFGLTDGKLVILALDDGKLLAQIDASVSTGAASVAFSPDGLSVVTAGRNGVVTVWDSTSGVEKSTFRGHTKAVTSVACSPDGKLIVSGSDDGTAKVWNRKNGREIVTFSKHQSSVRSVSFSPDSSSVASGSWDETIMLWDASSGNILWSYKNPSPVESVAFSPDGKLIVSGGQDKAVNTFNATNGKLIHSMKRHGSIIRQVEFSPDGKRIISGSKDKTAKLWDAENGVLLLTLNAHENTVMKAGFSPDGKSIITCSTDLMKIWNTASRQETLTLENHVGTVFSVAFNPDRKQIVSGGEDGTVRVWDAASGREAIRIEAHDGSVFGVAFSADGSRVVSCGDDNKIKVWNSITGEKLLDWKGHSDEVWCVAFSVDGRIASGSLDETVKIWDSTNGQELLVLPGHSDAVASVAFSPDGKRIVSGSWDNTIKVWDSISGDRQPKMNLTEHTDKVSCVVFSADGKKIVSGSFDKTLKVWDASTGNSLLTLNGHVENVNGLAISFDGNRIASASSDTSVKVWDALTGQLKLTLKEHGAEVSCVAFGPSGNRLVSGSRDSNVIIWHETGAPPDDSRNTDDK